MAAIVVGDACVIVIGGVFEEVELDDVLLLDGVEELGDTLDVVGTETVDISVNTTSFVWGTIDSPPPREGRVVVCVSVNVGTQRSPPANSGVGRPSGPNAIAGWHSGGGITPPTGTGPIGIRRIAQRGMGGKRHGQIGRIVVWPSFVVVVCE